MLILYAVGLQILQIRPNCGRSEIIKKRYAWEKDRKTILDAWGSNKKCQGTRKKDEKNFEKFVAHSWSFM